MSNGIMGWEGGGGVWKYKQLRVLIGIASLSGLGGLVWILIIFDANWTAYPIYDFHRLGPHRILGPTVGTCYASHWVGTHRWEFRIL